MATKRGEARRTPLTRDQVLMTAMELADRDGLDGVTMRSVGDALGVQAMSLYHHVANKDAILDGLADLVFAEVLVPEPAGADWRDPVRARMVSLHDAIARHPWSLTLLESRTSPGPASLQQHEGCLAVLRAAGFSVTNAMLAFAVLDAFVFGFAVQEQSLPFVGDEAADADLVAGFAATAERFPHMMEAIEHVGEPGWSFSDQFEPGLDLVLDAVTPLASPVSSVARPRRRATRAR
jgi:AcrR family transcriptional regulator